MINYSFRFFGQCPGPLAGVTSFYYRLGNSKRLPTKTPSALYQRGFDPRTYNARFLFF